MGMRVDNVSSTGASQSTAIAGWQQRQQNVKNLFSALQSGDLGAAQKAFSAMGTGTGTGNGQGSSLMAQIGQALQNGDLAGAQKAAQQIQANRQGHGHGHHHHSGGQQATPTAATTPSPNSTAPGSLLNLVA